MPLHEFAIEVIGGKEINKFQDKDTRKKLTDKTLVEVAEVQYPGISEFYKKACGYVHFSDTHIFHTISTNPETGVISGSISKVETRIPNRLRIEACISMYEITKLVLDELNGWIFTKNNPELIQSLRRKHEEEHGRAGKKGSFRI
jgi:hypothetical protein